MPSFAFAGALAAAGFCAVADGEEHPTAAPRETAAAARSRRLIMMWTFYHFPPREHLSFFFSVARRLHDQLRRCSRSEITVDERWRGQRPRPLQLKRKRPAPR